MFAKLSIFSAVVALAVATYGAPCATESDGMSVSAGLSATLSGVVPTGVQPTGDNPAPTPTIPGSPPLIPVIPSLISVIPSVIPLPTGPIGGNPGGPPVPTTIPGVPGVPHPTSTNPSETQSAKPTEGNPPSPSPTDGQPGNPPYGQPGNGDGNAGNGGSTCSTGPVQCCNEVVRPSSEEGQKLLAGLLGLSIDNVKGDLGLGCSPVNLIALASGSAWYVSPGRLATS